MPVLLQEKYAELLNWDIASAVMLSQIIYWYRPSKIGQPKLKVFKDGNWWIAKSHREWTEECGLNRRQSQRCLTVLRDANLIATRLFRFDCTPTMHIRLCYANGMPVLEEIPTPSMLFLPIAPISAIGLHPNVQPLTESTLTEISSKLGVINHAEGIIGVKEMKAEEVLYTKVHTGEGRLETYWKSRMATVYGGFQLGLTNKENGQLKHLKGKIGNTQVKFVIDFAINNWMKFGERVKIQDGLTTYPAKPNIGFLLLHCAVALELMQLIAKDTSTSNLSVLEETPSSQKPCYTEEKHNVLGEEDFKPYKPSLEEMQKTLESIKSGT